MKDKIIMQGGISAALGALAVYAGIMAVPIIVLKVFLDYGSTNRAFTFSKLWDVSTVAADYQVVIGSDTFYAVNAHTLMLIE